MGCNDVALVEVNVVDANGLVVPSAANEVTLTVDDGKAGGALVFVGGGNGDPACHVSDKSRTRPAFHGKLLGVYATSPAATSQSRAGTATVTAASPGLTPGTVDVQVVVPTFERAWWCERGHVAL